MTTTYDEETLTEVTVTPLHRSPGEWQRYIDEDGHTWRYSRSSRSITYIIRESRIKRRDEIDRQVRRYA